jgi:hypothetical protein
MAFMGFSGSIFGLMIPLFNGGLSAMKRFSAMDAAIACISVVAGVVVFYKLADRRHVVRRYIGPNPLRAQRWRQSILPPVYAIALAYGCYLAAGSIELQRRLFAREALPVVIALLLTLVALLLSLPAVTDVSNQDRGRGKMYT